MLHEKAEKRSSMDYLQPLNVHNLRIPSPCPLPAPNHAGVATICWEREVLLQVGAAARPHLQASFPSSASVSQVKSETSRWGGESKG